MALTLAELFAQQDDLMTRAQALTFMTPQELRTALRTRLMVVMPGIYAASRQPLTPRQHIRAALLKAGPTGMLTDTDGLLAHRIPFVPTDSRTRVLVSDDVQRSSSSFVSIRRTIRPPTSVIIAGFPTAPVTRSLCDFAVRHHDERDILAVAAAVLQRRVAGLADLRHETYAGPSRGRPRLLRVIGVLATGIRSVAEADFRDLVLRTRRVPEPLWNCLLELPNGRYVSPDGLWEDAALVHEVNSRAHHDLDDAGVDFFEDTQARAAELSAAGFTVLGNSPSRIRRTGELVIGEVASCYARDRGRGLPPGVRIVRYGPPDCNSDVTLGRRSA